MSDCKPVHRGPFFTVGHGRTRCEACGLEVSKDQVRTAAFRYLDGDKAQAAQVEQLAKGSTPCASVVLPTAKLIVN